MRVIRRKGQFGTQIEVAGIAPATARVPVLRPEVLREVSRDLGEPAAIVLARLLERRIGQGGGQRDPLPGKASERYTRDQYVTLSVDRTVKAWIQKQADERGLARGAFVGMIIEAAKELTADDLDDLLAG